MKKYIRLFHDNRFNLVFTFVLAIAIRLPLYHTEYWRTNDAILYINLARNLAIGHGFVTNIKSDYFTTDPVITSSFHGRTSLLSLFLAGIYLLKGDEFTMQLFIFLISAINACLVYVLARKWASTKWSLVVGILAATNPNLVINSRLILSEPLFTMFLLLALVVIYYLREGIVKYILAGCFISLSYLTRAEGLFLLPILIFLGVKSPNRSVKTVLLIGTFIFVSLPYFYGNYMVNGNLLYSLHERLYTVKDFTQGVGGEGYGKVFPTPVTFISNNFLWILGREKNVFTDNINSLLYYDYFGPFIFFLLLVFLISTWKKFSIFYLYALFIILLYTSAWSALFERGRHFTATFLFLMISLAYALEKTAKVQGKTALIFLATIFIPYVIFDAHRILWERNVDTIAADSWGPVQKKTEFAWIDNHINKNDIISSSSPEMIYLFTDHAGITTPTTLNKTNYKKYIRQYNVKYLIIEDNKQFSYFDKVADLKTSLPDANVYEIRK